MTVSVTTNKIQYSASGSTDTFAYNFKIYEDSDLKVYLDDTLKTLATHYTVTGAGSESGGNVVFTSNPASGVRVTIVRVLPQTQQTDYTAYDAFPAETHEDALDRLTYISHQLQEELARCMQLDPTAAINFPPFNLPELAADRVNKLLVFSSDGTQIEADTEIGTWRGDWATATNYDARDIFKDPANDNVYFTVTAHTSTSIAADVGSGYIELVVDAAAVAASAAAAATSETNAATSATNAATSETSAGLSASSAATDAANASGSAFAAGTAQVAAEAAQTAAEAAQSAAETAEANAATSASTIGHWKNKIINGAMDFWQRGTSFNAAALTFPIFTADRFNCVITSTPTGATISREANTAGDGFDHPYHMRIYVPNVQTLSSDGILITQKIEDVRTLAGKTVTVSFDAKAAVSKDISLSLKQDFGSGGSAAVATVCSTNPTITTSWARHEVTMTLPSISGKTLGTNHCLTLSIWGAAGSDFNAQTNSLGLQTIDLRITDIQVEEAGAATDFELRPLAVEEDMCRYYYHRMDSQAAYTLFGSGVAIGASDARAYVPFNRIMRTDTPTLTSSTAWTMRIGATTHGVTAFTLSTANKNGCLFTCTDTHGATVGDGIMLSDNNDVNAYIAADCEL